MGVRSKHLFYIRAAAVIARGTCAAWLLSYRRHCPRARSRVTASCARTLAPPCGSRRGRAALLMNDLFLASLDNRGFSFAAAYVYAALIRLRFSALMLSAAPLCGAASGLVRLHVPSCYIPFHNEHKPSNCGDTQNFHHEC